MGKEPQNSSELSKTENLRDELRIRVFVNYLFACALFLGTLFLVWLAYLFYNGAVERASEEAQMLIPNDQSLPDFYDAVYNPHNKFIIAVGEDSTIFVLPDDRNSGSIQKNVAGLRRSLNSVAISENGRIVLAVGDGGVILNSNDRGKSWSQRQTNTENDFNKIALSKNGEVAIAVGKRGLIRYSTDSGENWSNPGNVTSKEINDVALKDNGSKAVAVADDNVILESNQPFEEWTEVQAKGIGDNERKPDLLTVEFLDGDGVDIGVAAGDDGTILAFCDDKWSKLENSDQRSDFNAIAISDQGNSAIVVGRRGVVKYSDDVCKSWMKAKSGIGDSLHSVALSPKGEIAVAVGRDGNLLVSEDRGKIWKLRDTMTANRLYDVALGHDANSATVVGENTTLFRLSSTPGKKLDKVVRVDIVNIDFDRDKKVQIDDSQKRIKFAQIQTWFERSGTVLILVFLIQFLKSLIKYSLRLAAFYNARRDALGLVADDAVLYPKDIEEHERLIHALSPDDLEFERSSKSEVRFMMRLMKLFKRD